MRTRNHNWYDADKHQILYGIQVHIRGAWHHAHEAGTPCIYPTEAERDAKRAEIRKIRPIKETT